VSYQVFLSKDQARRKQAGSRVSVLEDVAVFSVERLHTRVQMDDQIVLLAGEHGKMLRTGLAECPLGCVEGHNATRRGAHRSGLIELQDKWLAPTQYDRRENTRH
jgi:hypothetical protein